MSAMILVYGGVEMNGKTRKGIRPAMALTKEKNKKRVLETAKKRRFNCVVIKDKTLLAKLKKIKLPDAINPKMPAVMVPFANAEKWQKVHKLVREEKTENKSSLTEKCYKAVKKQLEKAA